MVLEIGQVWRNKGHDRRQERGAATFIQITDFEGSKVKYVQVIKDANNRWIPKGRKGTGSKHRFNDLHDGYKYVENPALFNTNEGVSDGKIY